MRNESMEGRSTPDPPGVGILGSMEEAFLGAIAGGVITFIGQWFIGPRIERRVRAQERWEQFLVEFAALVDRPVKEAQQEARSAWHGWHYLHELVEDRQDLDAKKVEELNQRDQAEFREAVEKWKQSTVRADWLANRITGNYGVADQELRRFHTLWLFYGHRQLSWSIWDESPTADPAEWDRVNTSFRELGEAIEVLSVRIGVPTSLRQRVSARRRRRRELRSAAKKEALRPAVEESSVSAT